MYYRDLGSDKSQVLKNMTGNLDAYTLMHHRNLNDGWSDNIEAAYNVAWHNKPQHTIAMATNASHLGWVAVPKNNSAGGNWTHDEFLHNIRVTA